MSKQTKKAPAQEDRREKEKGSFGRPAHEQLVKGLSHPVRVACLTVLAERIASPRELAEALDEDLSNVSYHVRVLSELGLIELVAEEPVRGAVAHFYKAVERPLLSKSEWEEISPEVRKAISIYGWDVLIKDATTAIEKGTFDKRPDRALTRTSLLLDSEGFARLSKVIEEFLETMFEEQAASAARMNESGEEPIHTVAATALFEMPKPQENSR
ncbi:MAG TPA: winged helix-turn-helix domain-containing protein [Solirubrobacterales bacterium]|nr:winged helix-turn-helix domain-containing protein [Solirubrobacterales bacterium]